MYTLPFATVGTVNLTETPARSAATCPLFQSSFARLLASYACSTDGPAVPLCDESIAHTMPCEFPFAETDGVAPGNPYDVGDCDELGELNFPVDVTKSNACTRPPPNAPPIKSLLFQKAGVAKMASVPTLNDCTTPVFVLVNFPMLSRFNRKSIPSFPPPITRRCTGALGGWSTRIAAPPAPKSASLVFSIDSLLGVK